MNADSGLYQSADSLFKCIITQYPETDYATLSIKDLYWLNKSWNNEFQDLSNYLESISSDTNLAKITDFVSNKCNIELGNYEEAVDWYDSVLMDPPAIEDSIFALIDLMRLYLIIEQDSLELKSTHYEIHSDLKPKNYCDYDNKRNILLNLLDAPKRSQNPWIPTLNDSLISRPKLLGCYPNPCSDFFTIYFEIFESSFVCIEIIDCYGREVEQTLKLNCQSGKHSIPFVLNNQIYGIYLERLLVNNEMVSSKKLIIM
jgi:tetratricopeptide (TPR) repeat protein